VTSGPATKFFQPYDQQTHVHYLHHPPLSKLWSDGGLFAYAQGVIDRVETFSIPIVVANSELTADRYWKHYGRSINCVVNPPVDTDSFSWDGYHTPGKFVMIGRLEDRKRPLIAVEAFSQLLDRGLEEVPQLHLVGGGPLLKKARREAPENVRVHGYVEDDILRDIVESSDAGIFLAEREDFGITPIEYLAAGLPVLAVDEPNTNNQIEDGFSGVLVEPNPSAVTDGVIEILNQRWDREAIANDANSYRTDRFYEEIREVIMDV
jgi:glycosyltransferase involved in cell wall biosynthesis